MIVKLENYRCFSGKNEFHIKPITILVGENSTGKSALLSSLYIMSNPQRFPTNPSFNKPPFELGDYESIATMKKGGTNASHFCMGFENEKEGVRYSATAKYREENGHTILSNYIFNTPESKVEIAYSDKLKLKIEMNGEVIEAVVDNDEYGETRDIRNVISGALLPSIIQGLANNVSNKAKSKKEKQSSMKGLKILEKTAGTMKQLLENMSLFQIPPHAIAPIRSKPQRTYDMFEHDYDPEGSHVPLLLAKMFEVKNKKLKMLQAVLRKYGKESKMFTDVFVKKVGGSKSSVFQLFVKSGGHEVNIIDVGYGVSQCLPVLVQIILTDQKRAVLLQQPEVHLHPRAQAALGTFLSEIAKKENKTFIIETHSDYLIDRIRMEVAKKNISPDMVQILYFERKTSASKVHHIKLDIYGNVKNAPPGYRDFFLKEEDKLFSRKG